MSNTIYDINTDQQVIELLPPDKRYPQTVHWVQNLLKSTVQFLRDNLLDGYRNGSTAPLYAAGTYGYGSYVQYQKGVYVSLIGNNNDLPTVSASWYKVQDNFIGLNERLSYNGQKIVLEYALNRWFNTTFRQPGTGLSDIYLTTNPQPVSPFVVGYTPENSSVIYKDRSNEFVVNEYDFGVIPNLTINLQVDFYNSLANNDANRDGVVRSFADQYVTAGITYNIETYS
ncbi:hypothetical protein J3L18_31040 [Mucilaginibacter gossypii]|uniref:hypothetical protein n=1 Tax=Mucilaginibacter gossypii TaxID=551996 RepID=UPI000DCEB458|nr:MULTISPECIES: hypothetical protein [Mucilaginibacter]QTE37483.1 hypothetical protein J3L18_31040 [Mucilaginibacter gossypii]RAV52310.1 hypothetical protein DIU36_24560 [Mucilaginibacter rubeus]